MENTTHLGEELIRLTDVLISHPTRELAAAYDTLSDRYRAQRATPEDLSPADVAAYAIARLPATFAAARAVLEHLRVARPGWEPARMLDLGAGIGAATWAARAVFPTISAATLIEREPALIDVGRQVAARSSDATIRAATWVTGDVMAPSDKADLVVASYVLGELPEHDDAVRAWHAAATGELAIVEPGTPMGFARVRAARATLIDAGAQITAPCPHELDCPIAGDDWCHFAVRLQRTRLHREVKGALRGFEDEKYSYVIASRAPAPPTLGRILRRPLFRSGHVRLVVCEPDGELRAEVISRKEGARYKGARDLSWGDVVPPVV